MYILAHCQKIWQRLCTLTANVWIRRDGSYQLYGVESSLLTSCKTKRVIVDTDENPFLFL